MTSNNLFFSLLYISWFLTKSLMAYVIKFVSKFSLFFRIVCNRISLDDSTFNLVWCMSTDSICFLDFNNYYCFILLWNLVDLDVSLKIVLEQITNLIPISALWNNWKIYYVLISNVFLRAPFEVKFFFSDCNSGFALYTSTHFGTLGISPNMGFTYFMTIHIFTLYH